MAFPKLTKTKYKGLHTYKDTVKGTVYVGSFRINGKLYKKIVGYSNDEFRTTEKIAFLNKEAMIQEYKKGTDVETKKIYTFEQLFKEYIESVRQSQSISTIETKEYYFDKHIKPVLGSQLIDKIITGTVQNLINKILKTVKPKTKEYYKPQTATHINNIIKAVFNYAIEMNYIESNPAKNVKLPKFDNTIEYTLTEEESKKLFNTILNFKEPIYRGIFTFLLHGHRKSEVLDLVWDNVDFDNRVYKIPYGNNKVKKNKLHPITDELFEILINIEDKNGYVFKSPRTGTRFNDIKKAWKRIKEEAGIYKDFRIHDIRHLIGNVTINELGQSSNIAAAILGHGSTKMVEQRYSKVRTETISRGLGLIFDHLREKQ